MGKVLSTALRPLRTFNVANRAERVIGRSRPEPAPKYEADKKHLEKILQDNPGIVKEFANKNISLDGRLKDVFVSSTDPDIKDQRISSRYNPDRPLPTNRQIPETYEFGFKEPDEVKPGFITTRGVLHLITDHKKHPHLSTNISAKRYGISEEAVCNILKYYGAFDLHMPRKSKKNPHLLEYELERIERLIPPPQ